MITKTKMSLLLGTAMALAATPALADPVTPGGGGFASPPGALVTTGGDVANCPAPNDGSPVYNTDDAKTTGVDGSAGVEAPGTSPNYSVTTTCFEADETSSYSTNFFEETFGFLGFGNDELETGLVGQNPDFAAYVVVVEDGTANTTQDGIVTENQVFADDDFLVVDADANPDPVGGSLSGPFVATADAVIADYHYEVDGYSGDPAMLYTNVTVDDNNANDGNDPEGNGSSITNYQTSGGSFWEETEGTSSFDPDTGEFDYTPTSGVFAQQDVDGNTVGEWDDVAGTSSTTVQTAGGFFAASSDGADAAASHLTSEQLLFANTDGQTTSFNADGIESNGPVSIVGGGASYVQVNPNDVVIHGGDSSTTVTVNNAGVNIVSGGGADLQIASTGYISSASANNGGAVTVDDDLDVTGNTTLDGTLSVAGATTLTGLTNNGNFTNNGNITNTGTLDQQGAISNSMGWVHVADDLDVDGDANIDGDLQVDGYATFSGPWTWVQQDLYVDNNTILRGSIYNDGSANGGAVHVSDNFSVNGNTSLTGTLGVTGLTSTNGISNTGNITNTGNLTNTGNASVGGTLAVTGATTLTGHLTANGGISTTTLATSGNATIGGTLAVTGATTTNGITNTGNIATTTLSTTGAASVGTNLTVGGTLGVTGNTTLGGNLSVAGTSVHTGLATFNGNIQAGTVSVNSTTNKISGLANATLSATSTEAVTGQQLFATNTALSALDAREAAHYIELTNSIDDTRRRAFQGVAMNMAASAAPLNLANGEAGVSGGVGVFEGEWGVAVRAAGVTSNGVGLGANVGFSEDAVGGAVGASIKF